MKILVSRTRLFIPEMGWTIILFFLREVGLGNFCAGVFYKNCFPPKKIIMVHSYWLRVQKMEKKPDTMNVTTLVCYTINMGCRIIFKGVTWQSRVFT